MKKSQNNGLKYSKILNDDNKVSLKALSVAALAGVAILGGTRAGAEELILGTEDANALLQQKTFGTPTLDYLKENNVKVPQYEFQYNEYGDLYLDAEGNPVMTDTEPVAVPTSAYSMTEASEAGADTITKYEVIDVTRYYDKTTGELVETPLEGVEYKVVQEKELVPHYYNVNVKNLEYGSGDSAQAFDWSTDENGATSLTNSSSSTPSIVVNYRTDNIHDPLVQTCTYTAENVEGTFINNSSSNGAAISNAGVSATVLLGDVNADFINNSATDLGGAIFNRNSFSFTVARIGNINGNFVNNYAVNGGGAIVNKNASIVDINGNFINNSTGILGGAICNLAGMGTSIRAITGDFVANHVTGVENYSTTIGGGAIYNSSSARLAIDSITGNFIGNYVETDIASQNGYGGAIYNTGSKIYIGNITGDFIGNYVDTANANGNAYGGAIANVDTEGHAQRVQLGNITGDFVGNYVNGYSAAEGGAILNKISSNDMSQSDIYSRIADITGDFIDNSAKAVLNASGGAINNYSFYYGTVSIGDISGDFVGNNVQTTSSKSTGGAISNYAGYYGIATIGDIVGDFVENSAQSDAFSYGGAIYNAHNYKHGDDVSYSQIGNITGNFIGNYASGAQGGAWGGAIYNEATLAPSIIGDIKGDFIANYVYSIRNESAGGAIGNKAYSGGSAEIGNIVGNFADNYSTYFGGAIYNYAEGTGAAKIGDITGSFINNYVKGAAAAYGGAIYNYGYADRGSATIGNITGDFIGNYAQSTSNLAHGGAIYNAHSVIELSDCSTATIGNITGDFVGNYAQSKSDAYGGAIYNLSSVVGDITGDFIGNYAYSTMGSAYGGAIYNRYGSIGNITGDFVGNYSDGEGGIAYGGAIYNNMSIGNLTGNYIANYIKSKYDNTYGGALYNVGTIGDINGDFSGNYINGTYSSGGAIFNGDTIGDINGNFCENYINGSLAEGGAIYNSGTIGNITGDFIGNYTQGNYPNGGAINNRGTIGSINGNFSSNYTYGIEKASGGAIYNQGTIGDITGDFVGNYSTYNKDVDYGCVIHGAVIANSANNYKLTATIGNITGNFIDNSADGYEVYGVAIYNSVNNATIAEIGNITGDFIRNGFAVDGGAIYNAAEVQGEAVIGNITGNFIENYAAYGGAIQNKTNSGTTLATIGNITGDFWGNHATARGGAIYNCAFSGGVATIGDINGNFSQNYVQGSSAEGGAIQNYAKGTDSTAIIGDITGDFTDNYAQGTSSAYGGAIYNYAATDAVAKIGNITGNFNGNYASGGYGGAIYNGGTIGNITGDFVENYVYSAYAPFGGAIYNSASATIGDITGNFVNNYLKAELYDDIQGGAIYNGGTIGDITGDFLGNYVEGRYAEGGAIMNDGTIGKLSGTFKSNYTQGYGDAYGGAIYNRRGVIGDITGNFIENYSTDNSIVSGGAIKNNSLIGNIAGNFVKNYVQSSNGNAYGGAITNYGTIGETDDEENLVAGGIINSSFIGNYAVSENREAKGGAIYTTTDLNIVSDNGVTEFTGNYTENNGERDDNAIYVDSADATLTFELKNNGKTILNDNIDGATATVVSGDGVETIDAYNVNITGDKTGTFYLYNDIRNADVAMGGVDLNTINNQVHTYNFNSLTLTDDVNMVADVDLESSTMDRFEAATYGTHSGNLNVVGMNLLSDAPENREITEIYFAETGLKDNVTNGLPSGQWNLPDSKAQTTLYTPIYKYNAVYDNREDGGYFLFTKGDKIIQPGGGTSSTGNASDAFNPAVIASPVAAQTGASATMNQTFNYAFQNADNFMNIPYLERVSMKMKNRYALSPTGDATDVGTFSPLFTKQDSSSVWVKPYASFENIPLKNGPKVSNTTYGTLVGYDTAYTQMKKGWGRVWTGYIGYNGASQRYSGVDSTQNGGLLGGTLTLYKGNFFNATTVSAGATVAENTNMYGHENFTMLLAGIGNKTGYNFEFKEGKLILQPNMLVSYTFVNTFDYTNAAGVKIKSDPLHAVQLAPGLKVIGNLKGGWQPYASVNMVWNLLDKSDVTANSVKLPEMSIKPYVQYGVGVQKRFKDNCMAFGQAMIQNGGRNGVSLTAGFRRSLGKETKPIEKVQTPQATPKTAQSTSVEKLKLTTQADLVQRANGGVYSSGEKKIVKQLTQNQKTALTKNSPNTTRTTMTGQLKRL